MNSWSPIARFGTTEELDLIFVERCGTVHVFHRRDRTRLALILRGQRIGFSQEAIRTIIDVYSTISSARMDS